MEPSEVTSQMVWDWDWVGLVTSKVSLALGVGQSLKARVQQFFLSFELKLILKSSVGQNKRIRVILIEIDFELIRN